MEKYKILHNYNTEGYQFYDKEFETVDEAVKEELDNFFEELLEKISPTKEDDKKVQEALEEVRKWGENMNNRDKN